MCEDCWYEVSCEAVDVAAAAVSEVELSSYLEVEWDSGAGAVCVDD